MTGELFFFSSTDFLLMQIFLAFLAPKKKKKKIGPRGYVGQAARRNQCFLVSLENSTFHPLKTFLFLSIKLSEC